MTASGRTAGSDGPLEIGQLPDGLEFEQPPWANDRVAITTACRDTDELPKVENAGHVIDVAGGRAQVMHNGLLVLEGCYYGEWTTRIIRDLRGHHEPQEEVAFAEVLSRIAQEPDRSRPPTIIELGSFWAYYSMWFLKEFPAGSAVCLEPDPRYLEIGRRNLALNDMTAAVLHGVIGPGETPWMSFTPESDQFVNEAYRTGPMVLHRFTLPELLEVASTESVDLLLVDIQGAESPLLESSVSLLESGAVRYLFVSTHHQSISGSATTHQRALRILEDAGATILAEHTVRESFSGDGLIVASFVDSEVGRRPIHLSYARSRNTLYGEPEWECEELIARAMDAEAEHGRAAAAHDRVLARLQELEAQFDDSEARCDLLNAQLVHARQQRDELAQRLATSVSRRSIDAIKSVRANLRRNRETDGVADGG